MIRAAVFDIDGVLLDSMPIWSDVGARYLRGIGAEPEPDLGEILFRMTLEEGASYLRDRYALPYACEEIRSGVLDIIRRFYREEVKMKPGADMLIGRFIRQEIPMTLATTGDRELAEAALTRLGIRDCFTELLTASELHTSKHEPLIYLTAAAHMGTAPEETAVLEDAVHALRTAKKAGFYTIGIYDAASDSDWDEICSIADETCRF